MSRFRRSLIVALGVAALAVPAGAIANQGASHGKANGHAKVHNVAYVFKGVYKGESNGESMVEVKAGNAHVKKAGFIGQTVGFNLANARIVVADTNNDGKRTLADVNEGDKVVVKCMLPRTGGFPSPIVAQRLIDQTHPAS